MSRQQSSTDTSTQRRAESAAEQGVQRSINRRRFVSRALLASAAVPVAASVGVRKSSAKAPTRDLAVGPFLRWQPAEGQIVVAPAAEWTSLDPTLVPLTANRHIFGHIFDPLIHRGRDGSLQPALATSWERPDDLTIRFLLREGVTFHNGEPFDAEAVKLTLDRMIDPEFSQHAKVKTSITEVVIVDPFTVEIKTATPDPVILGVLADTAYVMAPQHTTDQGDEGVAANPVGTGAYIFDEWARGDHLTMSANPNYWGEAPAYGSVVFRPIPEASTRLAALQAGDVQIADTIPPAQAARLGGDDEITISSGDLPQSNYLGLRPKIVELQDVRVRQAINYGVDMGTIVENVLYGYGTPLGQPIPKGYFGHTESIAPYPYDPDQAKALLDEAGYGSGFTIHCDISNHVPEGREVAQAVASFLEDLGITMEIRYSDAAAMMQMAFPPGQEAFHETFIFYIKGPGQDADEIYSPTFLLDGVWNYSEYKNEEVDRLIREASSTLDEEVRTQVYDQLNQILHDEAPWLYMYQPKSTFGVRSGVNWTARPDGMLWVFDTE